MLRCNHSLTTSASALQGAKQASVAELVQQRNFTELKMGDN